MILKQKLALWHLAPSILGSFLLAAPLRADTSLFVAADYSAPFKTIQEAIAAAPRESSSSNQVFIHIKPGIYQEVIYVSREKRFVHLIGRDAKKTVLTFNLFANMPGPDGRPLGTSRTPSTFVEADDFSAENLTFENSAGVVGQALAIRLEGDRATFRGCRFLGWQDTIYDNHGRHYYTNCYIAGTTDFIFGAGTSFFDHCHIQCLAKNYITAASTPAGQPFGYIFDNCKITGATNGFQTFLGRPWRPYASVTWLRTEMSDVIRPEGWDNWRNADNEKTARYAEFQCTGPGAATNNRVPWSRQLSPEQAAACTIENILGGPDHWKP